MRNFDVAIIGAGVTGCAIARQLSRNKISIALIDKASDVAMGASRANSAIVHAGYDCVPGSLEAKLNVEGNAMYTEWCRDLEVPLKRTGSLVVAFNEEEEATLNDLYERGQKNGVPGMRIISGEEARRMEPMLADGVTKALLAETGGISCPYELTIACAENARANGAEWLLGKGVTGIEKDENGFVIELEGEKVHALRVVNAAGVFADEVSRMIGDDTFSIKPRKGEYVLLDRGEKRPEMVIFPTPTKMGKGILVAPTVDGNVFAGPTAVETGDKYDTSVSPEGIAQLNSLARKTTPALNMRAAITSFAGIRAQPSTGDFVICASSKDPHFIQAAGICSPGLTSAPAIAVMVENLLAESGLALEKKEDYIATRKHMRTFRHMTDDERAQAIEENRLYGRVICRCETITEAEIVEAVSRGATTVDGVKRRTRAGMGRCQGGFCAPRVMEIISRETGIPMEELTKFGGNSRMVAGKTRGEA